jgi:hypothetical protein
MIALTAAALRDSDDAGDPALTIKRDLGRASAMGVGYLDPVVYCKRCLLKNWSAPAL